MTKQSTNQRRLEYISTSNTTITIVVTPIGGSGTTFGPTACTIGSCVVNFTANPGPNTLAFTLKDGGGTLLSRFSTIQIVQPSALNTLAFTANPVVNSVVLQLASPTVNAGTPINDVLTVNAKDSDGNTIVGNVNYLDLNGNPVAFMLNVANSQSGGRGTVTIRGPAYLSVPGQAVTYAHYDGHWLANSTVSVSSTSSAVTILSGITLNITPYVTEHPAGITAGANPDGITSGADGNLWFTEYSNDRIGRITPSGTVTEFSAGITAGAQPPNITSGPDGNLWFTEEGTGTGKIGRILPSGTVTEFSAGIRAGAYPYDITSGPDGALWFIDGNNNCIGRITTGGTIVEFCAGISPGAILQNITKGSDGNLWFTEFPGDRIGKITSSGIVTEFSAGITAGSNVQNITNGPDGNIWFVEYNSNRIGRITPSGAVTEFSAGITAGANPNGITSGPDGNLWFVEYNGNRIGRITPSGAVTEFSAGISVGAGPWNITSGPDGNLWLTEPTANRVATFVY